ncbi:putative disease resistance RPP13-like protein 1 [Zea mays]|uniref:Putative disease resistance RPP13-like protein 1 n=1 Tax=Zea mays TaxID=4577 RepID=A0A3L6G664_MAIZE|nr:putative disease resistance RPP13-like protein 1 [Zea mays]
MENFFDVLFARVNGIGVIQQELKTQMEQNNLKVDKCSEEQQSTGLTKEILTCLPATENAGDKTANGTTNFDLLQKSIAERLKSKRFLIVLDDIWECSNNEEWEKLVAPFKKNDTTGNMILVTTRFPKIADLVKKETNPVDLRGLDPDEFWEFFQICAFGRIQDVKHGDQELIGIARQIADKLKCSPLAAKTVGRLLIKKPLQEHWMKILENKQCFEANNIPRSICYLSISMHDHCAQNFEEEMGKLKERIDIKNLRTLMIFGEYIRLHLVNILRDTFKEIRRLRVLSIFIYSHSSLPNNFSELIHLRYLKLVSPHYSKMSLPNTVSRFYHLKFLDLEKWESGYSLPKDISRLENICHFIASKEFHTNVPEVGKMNFLQELKEYHVKKESVGFELGELGKLAELGGELNILGLEKVRTEQEAKEAKLMSKRNLVELGLVWNTKQESTVDDILDSMQPHSNVRRLFIVNHGGTIGPSWLCSNIYMKNLETLHLESVSWANLPPIGQFYHLRDLRLSKIVGISQIGPGFFGSTAEKSVPHLKEVEFNDMPELVEWVGGANWNLFSGIERIRCTNCPRLTGLLISDWSISSIEDNTVWFPNLHDLYIYECPKLCLPPLPHTSKEALLANLTSLEKLTLDKCLGCEQSTEPMALSANLTSLTSLELVNCRNITMDGFDPRITFSIKSLWVYNERNDGTDPYSVAADLLVAVVRTKTMPDVSFKLQTFFKEPSKEVYPVYLSYVIVELIGNWSRVISLTDHVFVAIFKNQQARRGPPPTSPPGSTPRSSLAAAASQSHVYRCARPETSCSLPALTATASTQRATSPTCSANGPSHLRSTSSALSSLRSATSARYASARATSLRHLQLETLGKKADEAEDAVDELHYFMIQDKHDGTRDAAPELGDGLAAQAHHARHAARHTAGNWLSCFSGCCPRDDAAATDAMSGDGGHVGKLSFNRVAMSNKIKLLIEELQSNSTPVSDLLKIVSDTTNFSSSTERPPTSSIITQDKLFGRDAIFQKTIEDIIIAKDSGKTLSVLPIFGLGGIGKTTFTQHLYNHTRIKEHFTVRVWICVSTNFDILRLTKEILSCLPATENAGDKSANDTTNFDLLQKSIAERLKSKRFLIVLDDIWECSNNEEWEKLVAPFKKNDTTGNMILVTTRFPKIADLVKKETNPVDLRALDPDEFWEFFQICAFGRIQDVKHGDQELIGIARKIADKLKCSPLAAKTVGRLLIKKPLQEHWMKILENKQWLEEKHGDDIIPALQISYDYLPFHLKKCFSYFSLFPDDYKFDKSEIIRLWDSIGIIGSSIEQNKIEDIGSDYFDELLDSGFLIKGSNDFYVMHDLILDLSRTVSKQDCAYINSSSFEANNITQSIRYLSISMHDHCAQNFEEEMGKLKEKIDIKNLRTLMIFGSYIRLHLVNILRDTFKEIRRLRVLSIFIYSHSSLPNNFSELLHLRYLKLLSPHYSEMSLPNTVSRFYHLKFLDLEQWESGYSLPKDISRLENLRHFIASKEFHTNVPEVGKMKFLQELKEFHVKKESVGFELGELGKLAELGGELNILGLEMVRTEQEAKDAKLMSKRNLVELGLVWNTKQESTLDDNILDSIQPHSNVRRLFIVNHGGTIGPSWLCSNSNIYMKNLETLHLESVSWANLPPIGQFYHLRKLRLSKIVGISQIGPGFFGSTTAKSVSHLKAIEFNDMPELVEWVGGANWNLFSGIERIRCTNCPRLTGLLVSDWSISSIEDNTVWFPNLHDLYIDECPKLCLPPLPHTSKDFFISVAHHSRP